MVGRVSCWIPFQQKGWKGREEAEEERVLKEGPPVWTGRRGESLQGAERRRGGHRGGKEGASELEVDGWVAVPQGRRRRGLARQREKPGQGTDAGDRGTCGTCCHAGSPEKPGYGICTLSVLPAQDVHGHHPSRFPNAGGNYILSLPRFVLVGEASHRLPTSVGTVDAQTQGVCPAKSRMTGTWHYFVILLREKGDREGPLWSFWCGEGQIKSLWEPSWGGGQSKQTEPWECRSGAKQGRWLHSQHGSACRRGDAAGETWLQDGRPHL